MFAELPKLFDRDFAVGYFLPLVVFVPCMYLVASSFAAPEVVHFLTNIDLLQGKPSPFDATVIVIVLWLGAILLLVMNFSIMRFKEGYGDWNPLRVLRWREVVRFRKLHEELKSLEDQSETLEEMGLDLDEKAGKRLMNLSQESVERFPHEEDLVLPTAFGNVMRAWEMYPWVMHGIDAIPGWDRLIFLIPEKVRPLIEQDKAFMDFWLNVWLLNLLIFAEYVVLVIVTREQGSLWALLSLPVAFMASIQARNAAAGWGKSVKAAFDVYLPDLRDKLELRADLTRDKEHEQWEEMSRAMVYRNREALPPRVTKGTESNQTKGSTKAADGGSGKGAQDE
jgi:hypothetical protein